MRSVASEFPHVLFHSILILVEIPDKVLDVIIYYMYSKGEIISHPSDNVTAALFAFVGIGFAISVARKLLCGHRIAQMCCNGDYGRGETNEAIHLWMSAIKVWLEAFPQALITYFYFGDCSTTTDAKHWCQIFGFVSLLPFLVFGFHLCYYWAYYDCGKRYKYDKEPNLLMMLAMIATLLLSLGCIVATIHLIMDFNKFCRPPLGE